MELELARKNLKRVIDYVNDHFELEGKGLEESIGLEILKPDVRPVKPANRFPSYELSDFQYWELCNIYDIALSQSSAECPISDVLRLKARKKAQAFWETHASEGLGFTYGIC